MADQPQKTLVEYDLRPAFYDQFQCLASECRFTCCKGWEITFSKKDYLSLKRQDGSPELNENMKKTLRRVKKGTLSEKRYGKFDLAGGCCPLQRADGLCSLQLEKGFEALPEVCRVFPRGANYSDSGYLERSLSPACEGVLELLWNLPDGLDFVSDPLEKMKARTLTFRDGMVLVPRFQDIRAQCIDFLQDRRYPLSQRILLMGFALKELADGETDVDRWLEKARSIEAFSDSEELNRNSETDKTVNMFLSYNIRILKSFFPFGSDFDMVPEELCSALGVQFDEETGQITIPAAPFLDAQARFKERFADHDFFMENLMVSIFFNHRLPHVSSGEALWKSYVNFCNLYSFYYFMAVASCREGTPGDKDELFRLIVCASREVLHNGARQTALRESFFQHDSATLAHMAILLQ